MLTTSGDVAQTLRDAWRDALGREPDDASDFFLSGGDSLLIARMVARLRRAGVTMGPRDVLAGRTFGGILRRVTAGAPREQTETGGETRAGRTRVPLLPTQARWVGNRFTRPDHFNLGWVFRLPGDLTHDRLAEALAALAARHEALRTAYLLDGRGGAAAEVLPGIPGLPLTVLDIGPDQAPAALAACQRHHELATGAVLSAAWLPGPALFQVAVHHLTLDGYSIGVLADDLEELLFGTEGAEPSGARPAQPAHYAAAVADWLKGPRAAAACAEWAGASWDLVTPVPIERSGAARLPSMTTESGALAPGDYARLRARCAAEGLGVDSALTAAAATAIAERFSLPAVSVDAYHHSRDELEEAHDLTRTIGYLQATYPIVFRRAQPDSWWDQATADLARVPAERFSFDALRFTGGRTELRSLPSSLVRMNFRGQFARLNERRSGRLRPAELPPRGMRSPEQAEPYRLMLEGDVIDDSLVFTIKFSTDHYAPETVTALVRRTVDLLAFPGRAR
ncbi:condensation domain-containing protein [Spongiactinospora sp. TRM90649]|uniref:condensation domain-containing protein n=1 Tax=Spongiactinospora sp. TRM90649 TaxID=3031114 RepID=UPI0023F9DEDA|nr:condensation domain-containing protein [Spongiactinospora sp. TRM90649]MDF5757682.1 condensation domain-containing protein [Spongiactinospora sp. TRM90649]